ncbi:zinc finger protein ubi-d4-like isoform X1 [Plodia interpunctella]|uniref:zinc finger protein ubi-d4-like isoform X1 n=1 Tax=Plodia interpunctella TaxID=58824 RepID=UPI0023681595|nr:zinc finger protein ubi-d4-like isoform X1 [Plodia interpunctella]
MAAAEIQIVNPSNLAKIESFLNDPSYKEIIENSSTFNSRLCAERRMRMPFIDTQTGVAQSHCNLFMTRKQRMPGLREGQVYSYPAQRWRKSRRQYLTMSSTRWGWSGADNLADNTGEGENSSGVPGDALAGDDSRDGSQTAAKDDPKEWFYDEIAMDEMETGEEPEAESDEDYFDDTYANRRKRRGGATPSGPGSRGGRVRKSQPDDGTPKRGRAGRGRKRAAQSTLPYEVPGDSEKPFGCELCGAKYKTRAGLIYHFTHTHKDPPPGSSAPAAGSDGDSRDSRPGAHTPPQPVAQAQPATEYQDSYVTFLNNPGVGTGLAAAAAASAAPPPARRPSPPPRPASADTSSSDSAHAPLVPPGTAAAAAAAAAASAPPAPEAKEGEAKVSPSPYCDFCLGDDRENKKTGTPEELVSCSDCGRSGKRGRGRPPRNGVRKPTKCYHIENRVCEHHRHLRDIKLNGVLEIQTSMSFSADDFDNFAMKTKLLNDEYVEYPMSPPSSRQSPVI